MNLNEIVRVQESAYEDGVHLHWIRVQSSGKHDGRIVGISFMTPRRAICLLTPFWRRYV